MFFKYSLTSPHGHLSITDSSFGARNAKILTFPTSVYNTDTSVKRTLGSVPLVSVLKRFEYLKPRPGFLDFHFTVQYPLFVLIQRRQCQCGQFLECCTRELEGDVTRDDSQRRLLAQHIVAMLEQCCNYSKQCRNNVALKIVVANRLA